MCIESVQNHFDRLNFVDVKKIPRWEMLNITAKGLWISIDELQMATNDLNMSNVSHIYITNVCACQNQSKVQCLLNTNTLIFIFVVNCFVL